MGEHAVDQPVRQVAREQAVVECGLDAVGRLKTAPMMMPAQQGFETDNVAAVKVDLCLIEGDDTIVAQRLARLAQHRLTALRGLAHFGTKFANHPRTLCLRRVKREVCARPEEHPSELQS